MNAPLAITSRMLADRRRSLPMWAVGMAALSALVAVAFPTIDDASALDESFAALPPSVQSMLGLQDGMGLTSPQGYLQSQFYANLFPIVLLVLGIGLGAWCVAGDERSGRLELTMANPVSRTRLAAERYAGMVVAVSAITAVATATLVVLAPGVDLSPEISAQELALAGAGTLALVLVHASLAFAVGATTGSPGSAIGVAAGVAAFGFVLQGLAQLSDVFETLQTVSPWHWFLDAGLLSGDGAAGAILLPAALSLLIAAVGVAAFRRRDLR